MKVAVIAANGRSGREFVDNALKNGHKIRAGVFGNHEFVDNPNLEIIKCDATSYDDIKLLVAGCDAVVSLIGHTKKTPDNVQSAAITNVISVCKNTKIHVVSLTGTGVRFEGDKPNFIDKFLNFGIKIADPVRINDGIEHAKILKESDVNWTLLRVLKLTNGSAKSFNLTTSGPAKLFTSRTEVALAIMQVLESQTYYKKALVISPPKV